MSKSDLYGWGFTFLGAALGWLVGGPLWALICLLIGVAFIVVAHMRGHEPSAESVESLFGGPTPEGAGSPRPNLASPEIVGQVLQARYKFMGTRSSLNGDIESCWLLVKLRITNRSEVDVTLKDASLVVEKDGKQHKGKRQPIPPGDFLKEPLIDLLSTVTRDKPVHRGLASEGWLEFYVDHMAHPRSTTVNNLTVILHDELDGQHAISATLFPIVY